MLGRHCLLLAKSVFCLDDIGSIVWLVCSHDDQESFAHC